MTGLPPGFVLDQPEPPTAQPQSAPAGFPPGFVLDSAPAQPATAAPQQRSTWDNFVAGLGAIADDPSRLTQVGPGRIVADVADAARLPGDVATGKVDPYSDEGLSRARGMAMVFNPAPPARLTTQGMLGPSQQATQMPLVPAPTSAAPTYPVLEAAERAGVPVPLGVATDNRALQAVTQAGRQMPFGGARIEGAVDNSLRALSGAADDAAARAAGRTELPGAEAAGLAVRGPLEQGVAQREALAAREARALQGMAPGGGNPNPASLGDDIRASLLRRVEENRAAQQQGYADLHGAMNTRQPVVVSDEMIGTLQRVLDERTAAAQGGLPRELMPALDLATNPRGATFEGLQRARQALGEYIDFEAGRGFSTGDLKRAYGSLTEAMQTAVREAGTDAAPGLFARAEQRFGQLAERNQDLTQVAAGGSEALVNRLMGYASEMTKGNVERLRQIQSQIPEGQRASLSRLAFQKLGTDRNGQFDVSRFASEWEKLTPPGRAALFGNRVVPIQEAIRSAQTTSAAAREANADILRLLGSSDEGIANRVLAMATNGASADHAMLARLSSIVGPDGMREMSSLAIQRMGAGRIEGQFSPAAFATNWQRMSDAGKGLLFADKGLRSSLDDIATISSRMAEVERRFANKSGTGRATMTGGLLVAAFAEPMTAIATAVGGDVLGRALSQPATASSMAKWAQAYERVTLRRTPATVAAFNQASRNFSNTLTERLGVPAEASAFTATMNDNFMLGGMRSGRAAQEDERDRR